MLPSGLVLRKEREGLPALVAAQPTEERARAVVEAHNARVDQYYRRPVEGVWIPVGMADVDEELARWREEHPAVPEPPAEVPLPPVPSRRRGWWRRRAG